MSPVRTEHLHDGGGEALSDAVLARPWTVWLPVVAGFLRMQQALCEQLESLSREQSSHVAAARTDVLVTVLAERDRVIAQIMALNDQLAPFTRSSASHISRLPAGEQQAVQNMLEGIGESVERVRIQDEIDRRELEKLRKGVADELAGLVRGRGAVAAYVGGAGGAGASGARQAWAGDRRG